MLRWQLANGDGHDGACREGLDLEGVVVDDLTTIERDDFIVIVFDDVAGEVAPVLRMVGSTTSTTQSWNSSASGMLDRMMRRYTSDSGMILGRVMPPDPSKLEGLKSLDFLQWPRMALSGWAYPRIRATSTPKNHGLPFSSMKTRTRLLSKPNWMISPLIRQVGS